MKIFVHLLALVLLVVLAIPATAQGPGEGGIIIEPNIGDDVATMNPILANDVNSARITSFLFPALIGVDPATGVYAPNTPGSMSTALDVSEDGLTYTFTIHPDWNWSDGTPITANDWIYAYNAIASGETSTPRTVALPLIESVEAPDDKTLVIHINSPACNALSLLVDIQPLPAHAVEAQINGDFSLIDDMDFNMNPTVTAGPFKFASFASGNQVGLEADQNYPYTESGFVLPTGFIYKNVPDTNVALEQFLAGEVNVFINTPPERYQELRDLESQGVLQTFQSSVSEYYWVAFNLGNPANPQNGVDDAGNIIEQDPHPILGDVRVRQALTMALDMDAIIEGAVFGEAERVGSHTIPTSWAHNSDVPLTPYDPDGAVALLNEAGWSDEDGDGILEAHGAMYAEDGAPLAITLTTDAGDIPRETAGEIITDQWTRIGVDVNYTPMDFNVAIEQLIGQTFDASLLWWQLQYPFDPDFSFAFNPENDIVGGGFNFVSYNNPEVSDLLNQANNLPGCDTEARKELYGQAQLGLAEDAPYIFMYTPNTMIGARGIEGFNPYPNQLYWNVPEWNVIGGV
jgi:peptide/nickel transport system substrate-binding protein